MEQTSAGPARTEDNWERRLDDAVLWVLADGRLRDPASIYAQLWDHTNRQVVVLPITPVKLQESLDRLAERHAVERGERTIGSVGDRPLIRTLYNITDKGLAQLND